MVFYKQASSEVSVATSVASAGTTIADATQLSTTVATVTVGAANRGVILPDNTIGKIHLIKNLDGANALKVYPPDATGTLNAGSAGAAVTVAATETAVCVRLDDTDWLVSIAVLP